MINNVVLMGRLTAEPELKHTQQGLAYIRFTLAVQRDIKGNDGQYQSNFINIVAWRSTAEFVAKYFHKGQLVAIEGSIQTGSYIDKQGQKRYTTEVLAERVHFAERKKDNAPPQNSLPEPEPPAQYQQTVPDYENLPPIDDNGDIPFE